MSIRKPQFIYSNIPTVLQAQLESRETEIMQALGLSCPSTLHWHGEALDGKPPTYFLYGAIRGQVLAKFRGKNIRGCIDRIIRNFRRPPRRKSYIRRFISWPSRAQSEVVTISTFPTEMDGKACRRTTDCVWTGTWQTIGGRNPCKMVIGGLRTEDTALCTVMESICQQHQEIWGKEVRSQCLHEASHPLSARLATHQPIVMH